MPPLRAEIVRLLAQMLDRNAEQALKAANAVRLSLHNIRAAFPDIGMIVRMLCYGI